MKLNIYTLTIEEIVDKGNVSMKLIPHKGNDNLDENMAKMIINHCLPKVSIKRIS